METVVVSKVQPNAYDYNSETFANKITGNKLNIQTDYMNFFYCSKFQCINVFLPPDDKLEVIAYKFQELYNKQFTDLAKKFNLELNPLIKSYINKKGENVSYLSFNIKKSIAFDESGKRMTIPEDLKGYQVRISFVINSYMMNKKHGLTLKPLQIQLRKKPIVKPVAEEVQCLFDD